MEGKVNTDQNGTRECHVFPEPSGKQEPLISSKMFMRQEYAYRHTGHRTHNTNGKRGAVDSTRDREQQGREGQDRSTAVNRNHRQDHIHMDVVQSPLQDRTYNGRAYTEHMICKRPHWCWPSHNLERIHSCLLHSALSKKVPDNVDIFLFFYFLHFQYLPDI